MSEYPWGQVSVDSQDNGLISICCDVSRSCNALAKRWTASYSNDVSVCESHTQRDVIDIGDTVHIRYFAQSDWMEGFKKCWAREKACLGKKRLFVSERKCRGEKLSQYRVISEPFPSITCFFFSLLTLLMCDYATLYILHTEHVSISDIPENCKIIFYITFR